MNKSVFLFLLQFAICLFFNSAGFACGTGAGSGATDDDTCSPFDKRQLVLKTVNQFFSSLGFTCCTGSTRTTSVDATDVAAPASEAAVGVIAAAIGRTAAGAGTAVAATNPDEWFPDNNRKSVLEMIGKIKQLHRKDLDIVGKHSLVLNPGRQTVYAKDHEVALQTLARVYARMKSASVPSKIEFADIGCGLGTLELLAPFISDGLKPISFTMVEACREYFNVFKSHVTATSAAFPKGVEFKLVSCLAQHMLEKLKDKSASFDAITCLNLLPLLDDAGKKAVIKNMHTLLKQGGLVIASHLECNAGIYDERNIHGPGHYMAKVSARAKVSRDVSGTLTFEGGVDNTVCDVVQLRVDDTTQYNPQVYYALKDDGTYKEVSTDDLLVLALATRGEMPFYRYLHRVDKPEFSRMFSSAGFEIEHSGEYRFCEDTETTLLAGAKAETAGIRVVGGKGFYLVARKL